MAKKPELPKPASWNVYKVTAKQTWVSEMGAIEREVIDEKAAMEFRHHAALPAEKVRDPLNREVIFCAAGVAMPSRVGFQDRIAVAPKHIGGWRPCLFVVHRAGPRASFFMRHLFCEGRTKSQLVS